MKAYAQEAGSARMREMLAADDVAISRLSEVEVASALPRLARERGMTADQRDRAVNALVADMERWYVVDLSAEVTARARELLPHLALRAGDALQLASALVLQAHLPEALAEFVTFDARLVGAARQVHLTVNEY